MKYALLFAALLFIAVPSQAGRCTGKADCTACSNCSSCKHCSKDGGSCGMCKKDTVKKDTVRKVARTGKMPD